MLWIFKILTSVTLHITCILIQIICVYAHNKCMHVIWRVTIVLSCSWTQIYTHNIHHTKIVTVNVSRYIWNVTNLDIFINHVSRYVTYRSKYHCNCCSSRYICNVSTPRLIYGRLTMLAMWDVDQNEAICSYEFRGFLCFRYVPPCNDKFKQKLTPEGTVQDNPTHMKRYIEVEYKCPA